MTHSRVSNEYSAHVFEDYLGEHFPFVIESRDYYSEVELWCETEFGPCHTSEDPSGDSYRVVNVSARWDYYADTFYFMNEKDAVLFKLRFG